MKAGSAYLVVFFGAILGGVFRHVVYLVALRILGPGFPFGTLFVNLSGSLAMGILAGWFMHRADPGQAWRLFFMTGILGGFTTFSSFSLDTVLLWEQGMLWHAGVYVAASVMLSILGTFIGLALVRVMY